MRICLWATSFQSDIQALASHLDGLEDVELIVAMDDPEAYRREPVWRLLPLEAELLARGEARTRARLAEFAADVVVVDNHLPRFEVAPSMFVSWHGFGWRVDDLSKMRKEMRARVGDVTRPNPRFLWQAFGPFDRSYRIEHSGLAPENVSALGSTYSDLLLEGSALRESFRPEVASDAYPLDLGRPTVLVALTWHHGGALGHWGDDLTLTGRMLDHLGDRGCNVILRMHDRHRYDRSYVEALAELVASRPHVHTKYKSEHPDSLVDVLVSSILVTNYSSFANAWYYTGRPSVHIDPRPPDGGAVYREWKRGKVRTRRIRDADSTWKLPPTDVGGLRASSFEELLGALDTSLAQPDCCRDIAAGFVGRHITEPNGRTAERVTAALRSVAEHRA